MMAIFRQNNLCLEQWLAVYIHFGKNNDWNEMLKYLNFQSFHKIEKITLQIIYKSLRMPYFNIQLYAFCMSKKVDLKWLHCIEFINNPFQFIDEIIFYFTLRMITSQTNKNLKFLFITKNLKPFCELLPGNYANIKFMKKMLLQHIYSEQTFIRMKNIRMFLLTKSL